MKILPVVDMPDCFGTYEEGHPLCNGDLNAVNTIERKPCSVREQCRVHDEKRVYAQDNSLVVKTRHRRRPRVKPTPKAEKLYDLFCDRLSKELRLPWAPPREAPVPGQLFSVRHDRYLVVHVRDEDLTPVARVYLRVKDDLLSLAFPDPPDVVRYVARVNGFSPGKIEKHDSGVFRCRTAFVDRAAVSACARLAAKLYARRRKTDGKT